MPPKKAPNPSTATHPPRNCRWEEAGRPKAHTRTEQSHDPVASIVALASSPRPVASAKTKSSCSASVVKGVSSYWAVWGVGAASPVALGGEGRRW